MTRHTSFSYTLKPTAAQEKELWRNAGAARFAYNQTLRLVMDALESKRMGTDVKVPWSGFDLINAFNAWKRSEDAGVHENGSVGLSWRGEVIQEIFEEAAVDLGRALAAFSSGRKAGTKAVGFPRFKKRSAGRQSFRIRAKGAAERVSIRIGNADQVRRIRLPKIGFIEVWECTRKLRRMLEKGRAKILFATISHRRGGRWKVSINIEAAAYHPAMRHAADSPPIGLDRGLQTFAVLATADGQEIERIQAPRPLRERLPRLQKLSRSLSRKKKGSRNRDRARLRLAKEHERIANIRKDFIHRLSSRLAQTHGHLVLENLSTAGLMRTRFAKSIADSAWAEFASKLAYKLAWRGGTLSLADRFFPSTRRCSACHVVGDALPLSTRIFRCESCGHEADRDTNAAANLGQVPGITWASVAAKQAETLNVCREESAGAWAWLVRETPLVEAERAYARRPRRAVVAGETVNTL